MSASEIRDFFSMLLQSGRVHIVAGFVCSFLFGFVLGKLLFSRKRTDELSSGVPELETVPAEGSKEPLVAVSTDRGCHALEWRHEKLALTEQQVAESHRRLGALIDAGGATGMLQELVYPGNTLYYLSETIREERSLLGSDLSRLALIDARVGKLAEELLLGAGEGLVPPPFTAWRQKAKNCLAEIQPHVEILRSRQSALREILDGVSDMERTTFSARKVDENWLGNVRSDIETTGRQLDELRGDGVHEKTAALDKCILELLQNPPKDDANSGRVNEARYAELLRILAVDARDSRDLGKAALNKATAQVRKAFAEVSSQDDGPGKIAVEEKQKAKPKSSPAAIFVDQDGIATEPLSLLPYEEKKRQTASPIFEKEPGTDEKPDDDFSMVLFCANKPEWWNSNIYQGTRARAREVSEVPEGINWIGMRRLDTDEQVFCPITRDALLGSGEGRSSGFNGSNELFYDARHLGLFAESCKGDVETRFTYGGWGFGHKVNGFATEVEPGPPQASGWKGEKIPLDTVFEISVYANLPEGVEENSIIS